MHRLTFSVFSCSAAPQGYAGVQPGLPNMASAFNFSSAPDSLNMRQAGAGRGYDMTDDASRTDSVAEYVLLHCLYISHYHK